MIGTILFQTRASRIGQTSTWLIVVRRPCISAATGVLAMPVAARWRLRTQPFSALRFAATHRHGSTVHRGTARCWGDAGISPLSRQ